MDSGLPFLFQYCASRYEIYSLFDSILIDASNFKIQFILFYIHNFGERMITKANFKKALIFLGFEEENEVYIKKFDAFDCELKADFKNGILAYPENKGLTVNERQTCNFKAHENFVVFECVCKLLGQGYRPEHIELKPKWKLGHGASGGRADILVRDNDNRPLLIMECKTAGNEFNKAWDATQTKPTQLFSYYVQERSTQFIALYTSDFIDDKVTRSYYLINMQDQEEILEKDEKLKAYNDATAVGEIYQVWRDTYKKDFTTFGIFENNKAYRIGEAKPTKETLKDITSKDIQGKYHEFATILRQHNVSGRENAFDKLVNLFLCKVTDEKQNPDELKFYWNGNAYDDPFLFQDRLQQLYKEGMFKFLGEEITYIDESEIERIFEHYDINTVKQDIKDALKRQKFFTNNDFAFIDVHNAKLFYQNFEVLLKIARMIQDISLTGSDENQFLGDMFEGFLDQGVKQSEGQFFTPMPIVKFIISSLPPLKNPKVVDYACGAGHFLNEYTTVNPDSTIVGIEKEYRLSKVAKVSSFMYGSDMDIIYEDALRHNPKVKNGSFDVLVANPPYSVKGFLETLSDEERRRYTLTETVDEKSFASNNAIECFFIERAAQLLDKDGVAGIIVPSSILNKGSQSITASKGNVYVRTREILLKYFDIVAIAEFGSGTFGKTGTNTVTLFLRRRCDTANLAGTFAELASKLYECEYANGTDFAALLKEKNLLEMYCAHIEIALPIYETLLCRELDEAIFAHDTFGEYKAAYEKLSETKNRRRKKSYKALSKEEKEELERRELVKYLRLIEKEKFYYFALAYKNASEVLIIKSPSGTNENKKFLGYEWSSAKGNEGIKYLAGSRVAVEDETLDEEDKRILENLEGLKSINTPLYNPRNLHDSHKINTLIRTNFARHSGLDPESTDIPEALKPFVTRARLTDMLDFSRVEFDKAITLSPAKKVEIESKYPLVKIETVLVKIIGNTTKISKDEILERGKYPVITQEQDKIISGYTNNSRPINDLPLIVFGDHSCTFKYIDFEFIRGADGTQLLKPNNKFVIKYFYYVLQIVNIENKDKYERHMKYLYSSKIPLPPLDIQEQIVAACERVDDEVAKANETIEQTRAKIAQEIGAVDGEMVKLANVIKIIGGGTPKTSVSEYWNGDINWLSVVDFNSDQRFVSTSEKTITQKGLENSSTKLLEVGDIIISARGTVGALAEIVKPMAFNQSCYGLRPNKQITSGYLYYILKREIQQLKNNAYGSTFDTITTKTFDVIKIPLPSIETQKEIVAKIEVLESRINEAKAVIDGAKARKEAILREYL